MENSRYLTYSTCHTWSQQKNSTMARVVGNSWISLCLRGINSRTWYFFSKESRLVYTYLCRLDALFAGRLRQGGLCVSTVRPGNVVVLLITVNDGKRHVTKWLDSWECDYANTAGWSCAVESDCMARPTSPTSVSSCCLVDRPRPTAWPLWPDNSQFGQKQLSA